MATISDMGIPGGESSGILQPFYKNRWRIQFLFSGGALDRSLTSMAISAERPKVEHDEIQLDRYNSRAWLQGKYTFQPISITLEPDINGRVHDAIVLQMEKQQRLIGPDGGAFLGQARAGEAYKFTMHMDMLDGDHAAAGGGPTNILETWFLEGCAINNLDLGDIDYSVSETVKTVLQIRYDHAYRELRSGAGGTDLATGGKA